MFYLIGQLWFILLIALLIGVVTGWYTSRSNHDDRA